MLRTSKTHPEVFELFTIFFHLPNNMITNFLQDPVANSIAILTLLGMLFSIITVMFLFLSKEVNFTDKLPNWLIPIFSIIGFGISFYLSFIETTNTPAVCGPIGDCNKVQLSEYAKLFGLIPIGLIGMIGYLLIIFFWLLYRAQKSPKNNPYGLIIWILAWFGVLFSVYLTFLEPFIIGATCAWCITSAIIITLLLWASTGLARAYWVGED